MEKTTVYLPNGLMASVRRVAQRRGVSGSEVIREAIRSYGATDRTRRVRCTTAASPSLPMSISTSKGFGER